MSNLFATNNYIVIKSVRPKDELSSGIALTKKETGTIRFGWVIATSEGLSDIHGNNFKPDVEVGDLVYFAKAAPEKCDYSDVGLPSELYVISEGDIYTKIKFAGDGSVELLPMGNLIYLEELEDTVKNVTSGGIYLPDSVLERPTRGLVHAVGPGQRTVGHNFFAPRVKPGDIVRYRKHTTFLVDLKDIAPKEKPRHLVTYGDIVAVEHPGFSEDLKAVIEKIKLQDNYIE